MIEPPVLGAVREPLAPPGRSAPGSRSASHTKRRKRGARKGKGASNASNHINAAVAATSVAAHAQSPVLVSPQDRPGDHLRALENVSRSLRDDGFVRALRQARTKDEVWALLTRAEGPPG